MLEELKQEVCAANLLLPAYHLVTFTWGNVSGIDREKGLMVIKPSGVPYEELTPEKMVVTDLEGNVVEGDLNPSSDTKTHVELCKAFPELGGIDADYFYGPIPCLRVLTAEEIEADYERNTGLLIVNEFRRMNRKMLEVPGCLCTNHGPFSWGKNPKEAVHNAVVMEVCAEMATKTELINPKVQPAPQCLQDKHYMRKHGPNAYYGQKKQ